MAFSYIRWGQSPKNQEQSRVSGRLKGFAGAAAARLRRWAEAGGDACRGAWVGRKGCKSHGEEAGEQDDV